MRFGIDGQLWYTQEGELRRIVADAPVGVGDVALANVLPSLKAFPTPAVSQCA
jgi:hypothetical protein